MAEKRMYSKKITDSDDFIQMPASSQALYFHLNQGADDDGFNNQIQIAMLKSHASIDDLKVLMTKNFIMRFESGVVVVKHWWIHNTLRKDRYTPTNFQEELKLLGIKDNKAYTFDKNQCRLPNGCQMVAIDKNREEKISIVKLSKEKECIEKDTTPFDTFISKYSINIDNYSAMITEMDFNLLDKAFSESNWLCENYVSLSRICKDYERIVGGYYKDFVKPKEEKPDHLTDADFLIAKGFSKEWVMALSEEERVEKRKKWEK